MRVGEIMTPISETVDISETIGCVIQRLEEGAFDCLVVAVGNRVLGLIERQTIFQDCVAQNHDSTACRVIQYMTIQREIADIEMELASAAVFMIDRRVNYLPIKEYGEVVGVASLDAVRATLKRERTLALALDIWERAVSRFSPAEQRF